MKLQDLLQALVSIDAASEVRFAAVELAGISADSRRVKQGDVFVAVTGTKDDGMRFVDQRRGGCRRGHGATRAWPWLPRE
jgi:UDP-N-acetylmuramoyl-L-alanyl-D-glutamate--2,6-diaminopimelate ligase